MVENITVDKGKIATINLKPFAKYLKDRKAREYFLKPERTEHYKLLAYMADQMKDMPGLISDVGTFRGASALALWSHAGPQTPVLSYDVVNQRAIANPGIFFIEKDPLDDTKLFLASKLIMLDTVHDGIHEKKVLDLLIEQNWKGIVILDDINDFPEQREVWNNIQLRKADITYVGHWSGTGIIWFQ